MKPGQDLSLQGRVEIDEHVAANQQIYVGNRGVLGQIAASENYQPPNLAVDPKQPLAVKIFLSPLGSSSQDSIERVLATVGGIQGLLVNISGVYLDIVILNSRTKMFGH